MVDFFSSLYRAAYQSGLDFGRAGESLLSRDEIVALFEEQIDAATANHIDQAEWGFGVIFDAPAYEAAFEATRKTVVSEWKAGYETGLDRPEAKE